MSEHRAPTDQPAIAPLTPMAIETTSLYWETLLADSKARPPVYEDQPQPGRYRMKTGSGWSAVAIWSEGGLIRVMRDSVIQPTEKHSGIWVSCARHPITSNEYDSMTDGSQAIDPIYAQLPTDAAGLNARVRGLGSIPSSASDENEAARLADAAHVLKKIETTAREKWREEIAPFEARIAEIRAPLEEIAQNADAVRKTIMQALAAYLMAKNSPGGVRGQLGKAISLRTDKSIEITDYAAALAHFIATDAQAFSSVVEKLARAAIKKGDAVPGVKEVEIRRAQ